MIFFFKLRNEIGDCRITEKGINYRGKQQTTRDGTQCRRWDSLGNSPFSFPAASVSAQENYCRNPDHDSAPWCLTVHPNIWWQYCDVPFCFNGKLIYPTSLQRHRFQNDVLAEANHYI